MAGRRAPQNALTRRLKEVRGVELDRIRETTRQTYDLVGQKYHELFHNEMQEKQYDRQMLDRFARFFGAGDLVLDLGCGPSAHIGRYLFDQGLDVRGVDISPNCIEIARSVNPSMHFEVGDMTRLAIPDGSVDGIVSYYSIIHTPRKYQDRIFREFHRILRPGGKALVVVKEGTHEGWQPELLGVPTQVYFAHFTEGDIERYLTGNGFSLLFLETRSPYEFEIKDSRIYAIGERR